MLYTYFMIDINNNGFLLEEDVLERRSELYSQLRYIISELEKIDQSYGAGKYYVDEQEAHKILRIPADVPIPKEIKRVVFRKRDFNGVAIGISVYLRQDIDVYMASKKK